MRFHVWRALLVAPLLVSPTLSAQSALLSPSQVEDWRKDIVLLREELPRRHPDPFRWVTRTHWEAALQALSERLPTVTRPEAIAGLMHVLALIQDGHTGIVPFGFDAGMHQLPVRFKVLSDGVVLTDAPGTLQHLVGAEVRRIGGAGADTAVARVMSHVGHDNEWFARHFAYFYLAIPELLHAARLTASTSMVPITVRKDGRDTTVVVEAGGGGGRHHPASPYSMRVLTEAGPTVIELREVASSGTIPLGTFLREAFETASGLPDPRVVLDLRANGGGNNQWVPEIVRAIIQRPEVDRPDRLFVLIGGGTYSAAINLVHALSRFTHATFVGEPTGAGVNHFGDVETMVLPHTRVPVRHSTVEYLESPGDRRRGFHPDLYAPTRVADWQSGVDPAIEMALRPPVSIRDRIHAALTAGDSLLSTTVTGLREEPAFRFVALEAELNTIGYGLLNAGEGEKARIVFRAVTDAFPRSANAWDSLGESLFNLGRKAEAVAAFRQSVELDPDFSSPREWLRRLGATP